jgi:hypothetical protein
MQTLHIPASKPVNGLTITQKVDEIGFANPGGADKS